MLLRLENVAKRFGGAVALRNASLSVNRGEVHLLLGENGAGKSTLMRIVAGMLRPDSGDIGWLGQPVQLHSPKDAAAIGIAMVHQESLLAPHLSVAENIYLGREARLPFGWVRRRAAVENAARLIADHNFPLNAEARVERLSPAQRQLVEICRAIAHGSSLLIFDEPTSSLSTAESEEVFRIVRSLKQRGMAVVYITHRLEELRAVGDCVTILRDGETVRTAPLEALSTAEIIRLMVGREISTLYTREPQPPGDVLLNVDLPGAAFSLRAGEIVGLAGLVGAGRTELCQAIFGIRPARRARIRSPRDAVKAGLALIPEDRQRHGLAPSLPFAHNLTAASLRKTFIDRRAENRLAAEYIERLGIRCESPRQPAGRLSGGNQQKLVIAKWLLTGARVFLFDEPTRGIDVGAKIEVFELMDQLARNGAAILMVSSELSELIQVTDRILVMRHGRLSGELPRGASQEQIMSLATLNS